MSISSIADFAASIQGQRVGLVAHQASVDPQGDHVAELIQPDRIFGPEHGFFGRGAAGEKIGHGQHPWLGVPVTSLYGENRRPTPAQFDGLDRIVFDLQDLGFRCYTFVSTLRHVLEVAAECGVSVSIIDRPIPLPGLVDGPGLKAGFESFVAMIDAPMCYGLTPGEAARWLVSHYGLDVPLTVIRDPGLHWPPVIPPSPAIRSTMTAWTYMATVFTEALPVFDIDRHGMQPFQVLSAPFIDFDSLPPLAGANLHRHVDAEGRPGVRIHVTDLGRWRPVDASVRLMASFPEEMWTNARDEFFDKLYGTDEVRLALRDGVSADEITASWRPAHESFAASAKSAGSLFA